MAAVRASQGSPKGRSDAEKRAFEGERRRGGLRLDTRGGGTAG
jgi:hypothetical protein